MAFSPVKRAPNIVNLGSKNCNDWLMRTTELLILAECFEFADGTAIQPWPPRNLTRMPFETPCPPQGGSAGGNQEQQDDDGDDELQAAARETSSPQGTAQGQNNNALTLFSSFCTPTPRRTECQVLGYRSVAAAQGNPPNQDMIIELLYNVNDATMKSVVISMLRSFGDGC
ncbi:hypothetical protein FPQ18DRAFT_76453 [Pyronema domesticum]|nr:hypothetical protein FPQ18DRAFT_76453 [Pyronema domesticum]